jgi:hypothetical protein
MDSNAFWIIFWISLIALVSFTAYFAPSIVAALRHKSNLGGIVIVNLFLGWTIIGWGVALVMACNPEPQQVRVVQA